jgi:N6-adenosine-specific RNA methylase IME4
MIDPPWRIKGA